MNYNGIITENQLDQWVRSNAERAQGVIVELVSRLVAVSVPRPYERRFPLGDSIGQRGPDGELNTECSFDPFIPAGKSYWEIGTGINARSKATSDYNDLTRMVPDADRSEATFLFVTPLSGRRDWEHTWSKNGQATWLRERRRRAEWRDVRVIAGTHLIDWLHHFPAIEQWLAEVMGLPAQHVETPELRWVGLKSIGAPPSLPPDVFLVNREEAVQALDKVFSHAIPTLKFETHFPGQIPDFVAAYVASMNNDRRLEAGGRCLIMSHPDAWAIVTTLADSHVLVIDYDINGVDTSYNRLIEMARRTGHSIIYADLPGGMPQMNVVSLPDPTNYQVQDALEKAGYEPERARILAQQYDGNLNSLVRCLRGLPVVPEWAHDGDATDLAFAMVLGAWNENIEADKAVVELVTDQPYREWMSKMQGILRRRDTPLVQWEGIWKFIGRYEGWYALGPRLFDEHLDRLCTTAVSVLRERDPKFELSPDDRYMAGLYSKVLTHSDALRKGLADSLALIGSHRRALTSCSVGKAGDTACLAVREVLTNADWVIWASLDNLLPLLAEADPNEFLQAVEDALSCDPCPFTELFAQEGDGISGWNYMSSLLRALETLAWSSEHLVRVIMILGELASMDPGGNWSNRPARSLVTILLPWMPQTCAPLATRQAAIEALLNEFPDDGWKLLLDLLPSQHPVSVGSRKPAWRALTTNDCAGRAIEQEYWAQIAAYARLTIAAAQNDVLKLTDLIDSLDMLDSTARDELLAHLRSDTVLALPESDRGLLWNKLIRYVMWHRRFAVANPTLNSETADEIAVIAERLKPTSPRYCHRRLFGQRDHDLFEEIGDYEKQHQKLVWLRQEAVNEVFAEGGIAAVLDFAGSVETPWQVGFAFGAVGSGHVDKELLPILLESKQEAEAHFVAGFVWGRFRTREWSWIDNLDTSGWSPAQKAQLLAYLPFAPETWKRVVQALGDDEFLYWSRTHVTPYDADSGLELAIDRLIENGRAQAALDCLDRLIHLGHNWDSHQAVRVLNAVLQTGEVARVADHAIVDVIKMLQDNPDTNADELFQIEWSFLPLLDSYPDAAPKSLEQRLADDPTFFCEVIRVAFKSRKKELRIEEPTEQQQNIAQLAYRLLSRWRTPPGSQKDCQFDAEALTAWVKKMKTVCAESGHSEIASQRLGHVLTHMPPDPDGLWIHRSAARLLNARDAKHMRTGFRIELSNSRGVYFATGGREEQHIAQTYRKLADEIEAGGYHRLAVTLRDLAGYYERLVEKSLYESIDD